MTYINLQSTRNAQGQRIEAMLDIIKEKFSTKTELTYKEISALTGQSAFSIIMELDEMLDKADQMVGGEKVLFFDSFFGPVQPLSLESLKAGVAEALSHVNHEASYLLNLISHGFAFEGIHEFDAANAKVRITVSGGKFQGMTASLRGGTMVSINPDLSYTRG